MGEERIEIFKAARLALNKVIIKESKKDCFDRRLSGGDGQNKRGTGSSREMAKEAEDEHRRTFPAPWPNPLAANENRSR